MSAVNKAQQAYMINFQQEQEQANGGPSTPAQLPMPSARPVPPEELKKKKDSERLQQRVAAKQHLLAQLGIDWQPDDDDLQAEFAQLPEDSDDIVRWSRPEIPVKKEEKDNRLDFEPFEADDSEYVTLASSESDNKKIAPGPKPEKNLQPQPPLTPTPATIPPHEVVGQY